MHQLLGGAPRDKIRVYGWLHGETFGDYVASARAGVERGFTAFKTGVSGPVNIVDSLAWVEENPNRFAAIREAARPLPEKASLRLLLGFAVLFRLTLLGTDPFLSDDLYRYLWDGHLQVNGGLNPYLHEPSHPILRPLRTATFDRMNHPEVPTIYTPVAQFVFAATAGLGGSAERIATLIGFSGPVEWDRDKPDGTRRSCWIPVYWVKWDGGPGLPLRRVSDSRTGTI